MTENKIYCHNCGEILRNDWKSCASCGTIKEDLKDKVTSCDRCHQLIAKIEPVFCPYCQYKLGEKIEKKSSKPRKVRETRKIEALENEEPLSRSLIWGSNIFRSEDMKLIAGNHQLRLSSIFNIVLMALLSSTSLTAINFIFVSRLTYRRLIEIYLSSFFIIMITLILFYIFLSEILKLSGHSSNRRYLRNLTASYLSLVVGMNIFIGVAIGYIWIFSGDDELAFAIYMILGFIFLIYMAVQFMVYLRNILGISILEGFLKVGFAAFFASGIGIVYTGAIVGIILEMIL